MKIIVTGFDPFGGEPINPSWEAVKRLDGEIHGHTIIKIQLPTVFGAAGEILTKAIRTHRPHQVICVGQAGGRRGITVERIAVNLRDAKTPDNAGNLPQDEPIRPEGETAYFATLPIKAIVEEIQKNGISAAVSNSAGTYVCNDVMYTTLHLAAREFPAMKCGFIHVPYVPEQVSEKPEGTPSMTMDDIVRALTLAVKTLME